MAKRTLAELEQRAAERAMAQKVREAMGKKPKPKLQWWSDDPVPLPDAKTMREMMEEMARGLGIPHDLFVPMVTPKRDDDAWYFGTKITPCPPAQELPVMLADDVVLAVLKLWLIHQRANPGCTLDQGTSDAGQIGRELGKSGVAIEAVFRAAHNAEQDKSRDTEAYARLRDAIVQVNGRFEYRPKARWLVNLWLSGVTPEQVLAYPYTTPGNKT